MEGFQRLICLPVHGQNDQKKQGLNVPNSRLVAPFGTGIDPKEPLSPLVNYGVSSYRYTRTRVHTTGIAPDVIRTSYQTAGTCTMRYYRSRIEDHGSWAGSVLWKKL